MSTLLLELTCEKCGTSLIYQKTGGGEVYHCVFCQKIYILEKVEVTLKEMMIREDGEGTVM